MISNEFSNNTDNMRNLENLDNSNSIVYPNQRNELNLSLNKDLENLTYKINGIMEFSGMS